MTCGTFAPPMHTILHETNPCLSSVHMPWLLRLVRLPRVRAVCWMNEKFTFHLLFALLFLNKWNYRSQTSTRGMTHTVFEFSEIRYNAVSMFISSSWVHEAHSHTGQTEHSHSNRSSSIRIFVLYVQIYTAPDGCAHKGLLVFIVNHKMDYSHQRHRFLRRHCRRLLGHLASHAYWFYCSEK